MAVCSRPGPGTGQKAGEARGPSRPVFLLTLAVITSSSLSALSLYQLVVLREEVEGLKSEACRRREDGQEGKHGEQVLLSFCCRFFRLSPPNHLVYSGIPNKVRHKLSAIRQPTCTGCWPTGQNVSDGRGGQTDPQHTFSLMRRRRMASGTDSSDSLSCLQLLANKSRKIFRKDFALEPYTGIPWQTGLRKGSALETLGDNILIRQEGFYFVYSQEEDSGGRRGSARHPVPLHPEHGQHVPLQHVLHGRCREAGGR
ncbi:tumor necrosis factor ligand superfamily member 13B isoform X2 [Syngnathoides biaculeatus]|uniref:tumor necrosis factor ligand superfamily member 13B isoform X2 n=1 Tax=Syngnathoides biaculeatus TaxID=300417 RepID=UPI002ADD9D01|nr:tumor necrosis factor ligand superfamily member 13B isoform X2 [Syngnathoides biaculeatus]